MYLCRVLIDPFRRTTQKAFINRNLFHQKIEEAVNQTKSRKLWRLDFLNDKWYLLLVCESKPDLRILQKEFGSPAQPGVYKEYDDYIDSIQEGKKYQFRVVLNPTVTGPPRKDESKPAGMKKGKVTSISNEAPLIDWFIEKGKQYGYTAQRFNPYYQKNIPTFQIQEINRIKISKDTKKGGNFSFSSAEISGFLTVDDVEKFKNCLKSGMGREKAYGQGLMTVIPVS